MTRFALFGLWVLGCVACEVETVERASQDVARPARIYEVSAVSRITRRSLVARVEAPQTVDMSFQVSGPLIELPVREGEIIPKGQVIAVLDPSDFQRMVREAQVQLDLARQDLARKRELLREQLMSVSAVDDATALYELRKVRLDQAREDLSDARIVAPFEAYVSQRFVDNHVNVDAGDDIVRVLDLTRLYLVANVPEQLAATVTNEQITDNYAEFAFAPGRRFEVTYHENRGEADAVAQTYEVTFLMDRPDGLNILPGMTATLVLEFEHDSQALAGTLQVPPTALVADPDKRYFVWLFDPESGVVTRRHVDIGVLQTERVTITSGLESGDLIVAAGAHQLREGMRVRVLGEISRDQRVRQ